MARFTRRARLLKAGEFAVTLKQGRRYAEPYLTAVARANSLPHARLGFAIAKKSVALATQRNRIKRKLRATFAHKMQQLPALDIVFMARPGCAQLSASAFNQSMERLWTRIAASSPAR